MDHDVLNIMDHDVLNIDNDVLNVDNATIKFALNGVNASSSALKILRSPEILSPALSNATPLDLFKNTFPDENTIFQSPMPSKFNSFLYGSKNTLATTPVKRSFDNLSSGSSNLKKTKLDYNITSHEDTSKHLLSIIDRVYALELNVSELITENTEFVRKNFILYNNLGLLKIDNDILKKEVIEITAKYKSLYEKSDKATQDLERNNQIAAFDVKIKNLESLINKDIEMIDNNQQNAFDKRSFVDLFKNNDNKTISEPVHDLINILSNNEDEKRKREYNIIVFGLNVKSTDTNFTTIMNLMNELGVNKNKIWDVCYLKKKDVINENAPIKIVASSLEAKYFILKAARKLQAYNVKNKTKINISVDMSNIDRQINKKLVDKRNELNSQLKNDDKFYFGIRDNKVIKLNKRS
jgi:hypothetical protein